MGASHYDAFQNLGGIKFIKNDFAHAIEYYDKAATFPAAEAVVFNNRGKAKSSNGDLVGSLSDFDRTIALKAGYAKALGNRGAVRFALGNFAGAGEDLGKTMSSEGESPELLRMLRICKYQLKEEDVAKSLLEKAVKAGIKDGKVNLYLGYLRFEKQEFKGAVETFTAAEGAGEKELSLYEKRGKSLYLVKDYTHATIDLEKVVQQGHPDLTTIEFLGLGYIQQQKNKEALAYLEKASVLNSQDKDVYFQLGNGRFKDNNFPGATEAYDKAIALGANDEVILNNRGKAKLNSDQPKESIADFDKALQIKPNYVKA